MVNLALTSLVLLAVFLGIFFFIKNGVERQAVDQLRRISQEGEFRPAPLLPRAGMAQSGAFYIKTDRRGRISELSPTFPFDPKKVAALLRRSRDLDQRGRWRLNFEKVEYRFLIRPTYYGFIYVFLDTRPEKGVISWFIIASAIIGGFSLGLVALVSLFLANRALVPIKEAWERQQSFVADASHELRTPLAVIQTNLELIRDNPEETVASQAKWLENIAYGCNSMAGLVDSLLFLARSEERTKKVRQAEFSLSAALGEVVAAFEPVAGRKGVFLSSRIMPELRINGNEARLKQLAGILLDNGVKYTPQGGSVNLKLEAHKGTARLTVSDTGEGIPKEYWDAIFRRFFRVEKSRRREAGGSGLGLAIAASIVKEHGGMIRVSSEVGRGSVFQVSLPGTIERREKLKSNL